MKELRRKPKPPLPRSTQRRFGAPHRAPWGGIPMSNRHHTTWRSDNRIFGSRKYVPSKIARNGLVSSLASSLCKDPAIPASPRSTFIRPSRPLHRPATGASQLASASQPTRPAGRVRADSKSDVVRPAVAPTVPRLDFGGADHGAISRSRAAAEASARAAAEPRLTPRARVIIAALPALLGNQLRRVRHEHRNGRQLGTRVPTLAEHVQASSKRPDPNATTAAFATMARADATASRQARANAVLSFFKRVPPQRAAGSSGPVRTTAESENGRMAAESFFKYARPWGGQPAISYPSRTAPGGARFVH